MKLNCRIGDWKDARYKHREYDTTAPPDIIKKVNHFIHRWESVTKLNPNHPQRGSQQLANQLFYDRLIRISNILEQGRFNSNIRNAVQTRTLDKLGKVKQAITGTGVKEMTRQALVGLDRRARGLVTEALQDLEVVKLADNVHRIAKDIGKRYGLNNDQLAELEWDVVELATQPYLVDSTLNMNEMAHRILTKRRDAVLDKMQGYNIIDSDIEVFVESAKQLVQANQELAALVGNIGVDITPLKEMGYLPRVFTKEMEDVFAIIDGGGVYNPNSKPITIEKVGDATAAFQESRKYFDFVTADVELLDYWFKQGEVYKRLNQSLATNEKLRAAMGKDTVSGIQDLLSNPDDAVLSHAFVNIIDPDDLDTLFELGVVSKVPWQTSRVHKYLQEKHQLPFGLSDMYISDPPRVMDIYGKQLQHMAVGGGKVWGLVRGAIDEWGLPEDFVATRPEFKDWVTLADAIPEKLVEQVIGSSDEAAYHMSKTYIPPEAAKLIKADMTIVTDPMMLGIAGNVMKIMKSWFGGFMLGTTQWFGRQVFGWAGNVLARGANPVAYFSDLSRYLYARMDTWKKGITNVNYADYLPNKKKVYFNGQFTEAELWKYGLKKGLFSDFNVFGEQSTHAYRSWDRTAREFRWYAEMYPNYVGLDTNLRLGSKALKELMADNNYATYFLSWGNSLTDNMGKWALLKSVASDKRSKIPQIVDPLPHIRDADDAIQWVFDHSWNYDDLNVGGHKLWNNTTAQFMIPFIQWRIKNAQQAWLMLTEHPHLFSSYLYLTGRPNDQFKDERPVEYEIINDSWWDEQTRPLWWTIPGELHPSGKDQTFMYPLTNFLPQLGAVQDIDDIFDTLQVFGEDKKKLPSDRTDNPYKKRWGFLQRLAKEQTLPMIESMISLYNREDSWGQTYDELREKGKTRTLLGVEIDPVVHYHVTNLMPVVKQLDRSLSYTGLTGEAPTVDPITGDFAPGKPSIFGATPDYPVFSQQPTFAGEAIDWVLQMTGLLPYHINVEFSAQRKPNDIRIMIRTGEKKLKQMRYNLAMAPTQERIKELQDQYNTYLIWNIHLATELAIYEKWRKDRGISDKKATDAILQHNLYVRDLLGEAERERIEVEIAKKYLDSAYHNP